jgi:hypothetical protein
MIMSPDEGKPAWHKQLKNSSTDPTHIASYDILAIKKRRWWKKKQLM